jgi:F-type H+-transporting ATPase subunit delta
MAMEEIQQETVLDTDQQQLGETYARALIGVGEKNNTTATLLDQFDAVVDVLRKLPRLSALLQSPRVSADEKKQVLDKAFGQQLDGKLLNFLRIIIDRGRFNCLVAIQIAAHRIHDGISGRVQATLTTAEPVDDSVRQRVQDKLSGLFGKQVQLAAAINPEIIGGMVVRIGDTVYDASVRNRLNQLRTRANRNVAHSIRSSIDKFMAG